MKRSIFQIFLLVLFCTFALPVFAADKGKESAYERVLRTGMIRCGYGINKPWIYEDMKTGAVQGLYVDIINAVAEQLSLKLDWPEETGWGNLPSSLLTGRVDATCSILWVDPARGRQVAYTRPLFFTPIYVYARADDPRFDGPMTAADLNDPAIRIVTVDGNVTAMLAARYFSAAGNVSLPQMASWSEGYLSVASGKGDVIFSDAVGVAQFNESQEIKLKKIDLPDPVTVYGSALAVGIHEQELRDMLDTAVSYLLTSGRIQELTDAFEKRYPGALIPVKKPYETE